MTLTSSYCSATNAKTVVFLQKKPKSMLSSTITDQDGWATPKFFSTSNWPLVRTLGSWGQGNRPSPALSRSCEKIISPRHVTKIPNLYRE